MQTVNETKPKKDKFFKNFFKKKNKETSKNFNSNNNKILNDSTADADYEDNLVILNHSLRKAKSNPELSRNKIELDDELLNRLNDNFQDLIIHNHADAKVTINYFMKQNIVSITFYSILNLTENYLKDVYILVDIFYDDKWQRRLNSKINKINLAQFEEKSFDQNFLIEFKQMNLKKVKMNTFIVGKLYESSKSNFVLASKSSKMQILGGAHIILEKLIS